MMVRFIADRLAWWLLRALHRRDLANAETLVVIGSQPRHEAGSERASGRFPPVSFRECRVLVAQAPMKHLSESDCALKKFGRGGTPFYCTSCRRPVSVRDPDRCEEARELPAVSRSDTQ